MVKMKSDLNFIILKFVLIILIINVNGQSRDLDEEVIPHHGRCEPITIQMCKDIQYNETIMPNLMNHHKQEEAGAELHQYFPLVKVQCSPDLQLFLCSIYAPVCTILEVPLQPCRSLCLSAREGCESLMSRFGYSWPESMDCSKYPIGEGEEICFGKRSTPVSSSNSNTELNKNGANNYHTFDKRPLSTSNDNHKLYNTIIAVKNQTLLSILNLNRTFNFFCPLQMKVPSDYFYSFTIHNRTYQNCGPPCDDIFFTQNQRKYIRVWIGTLASLCVISTTFTVLTFIIDATRFKYPERPIIFLSICYLFIGCVYVFGFSQANNISCSGPFNSQDDPINLKRFSLITQGAKKESCTLSFMILYFFTMSSAIWWVILTLTWVLAATFKWSPEAIETNSHYFHLIAWALPAVKTMSLLAMGKIEGDFLSGVCYIGLFNQNTFNKFVFLPHIIYLAIGIILLAIGFVSLLRIRTLMKLDGNNTDKLEKLIMRIVFFSLLYVCPLVILLSCYNYEMTNFDQWLNSWLSELCLRKDLALRCPPPIFTQSSSSLSNSLLSFFSSPTISSPNISTATASTLIKSNIVRPNLTVFFFKYLAIMMAGITSSFWICSKKTYHSWANFLQRIFRLNKNINEVHI